ncbi:MAG: MGH1-like glycoside hydrolase domain-containing protein, partial [Gemmatimonadaceae bacterium]
MGDRAWGTVREDYSANGDAWSFLTHDMARSKAYRWGEDAIAGVCDRYQLLVCAPAFWNGCDPILKERYFGLTAREGNRGEDVKEYYFYLDNTPTHSYMRMLYKYPQAPYPYQRLLDENRARQGGGMEFELLDTGVFDENRYFDIAIEHAKASPEDICIRIEAFNRGPAAAELHVIPQLWFRNTWAWGVARDGQPRIQLGTRPSESLAFIALEATDNETEQLRNLTVDYQLGTRWLYGPADGEPMFTNNETNGPAVWGPAAASASPFTKDAFHRHIVRGEAATNPVPEGTKGGLHYRAMVPAGGSIVWRFRLAPIVLGTPLHDVDAIVAMRKREADEFYAAI